MSVEVTKKGFGEPFKLLRDTIPAKEFKVKIN
jgi:hypothetical protein